MKIKTGDKVRVIAGKDKGKEGTVLQVFNASSRLVIEGLNLATRHLRGRGTAAGQKVQFPSPMHISNVMLVGPSGMAGRAGYKVVGDKKIRVIRSKGKTEDVA